ncbi:hypothetical protein HMSSN036_41290 [Paenibacillus macerans]|nr:hypothetical protein HMSSN036_41290 [Paenibacillus macerans]
MDVSEKYPDLEKALCYRLLHHDRGEWPDIQEQMAQLGFTFSASLFSVILFRIDKYYDFLQTYDKTDQSLLRFFTYKMAEEMGGQSFKTLMWNTESRDIVMIANALVPMEDEAFKARLESVIHSIVVQINSYLRITITAVIGHPVQEVRHIPDSWNRIGNFMESKRYGGGCHVLKCWDQDAETPFLRICSKSREGGKTPCFKPLKATISGKSMRNWSGRSCFWSLWTVIR